MTRTSILLYPNISGLSKKLMFEQWFFDPNNYFLIEETTHKFY